MKKILSILGGMAAVALLMAVPLHAEMMMVEDSDLDVISGKGQIDFALGTAPQIGHPGIANFYQFGSSNDTIRVNTGSANIQVGQYQWHDNHAGDLTIGKGSNFFETQYDASLGVTNSGAVNMQENVVAISNSIVWGSRATGLALIGEVDLLQGSATPGSTVDMTGGANSCCDGFVQESMGYAVMAVGGF